MSAWKTLLLALATVLAVGGCGGDAEDSGGRKGKGRGGGGAASRPNESGESSSSDVTMTSAPHPGLHDPSKAQEQAPSVFKAKFETSRGNVIIEVTRAWSPNGADRFYNLVKCGFFDEARFFRVIVNFMAQIGVNGDPAVHAKWKTQSIKDDPNAGQSNRRGYVSFAKPGRIPNARTTQVFINLKDNRFLDRSGFTPVGRVVEGMSIVDLLYNGYGDGAPKGRGPPQGKVIELGNSFLIENFPKLDHVKRATIVE